MKRTILLLSAFLLLGIGAVNAQNADKKWGFGVHFGLLEYQGDYANGFYTFKPNFALGASIARYVNPSFDFLVHYYYGETRSNNARFRENMPAYLNFNTRMQNLNLQFKYKFNNGYMLQESAIFAPFLIAGFGANVNVASGNDKNNLAFINREFLTPSVMAGLGINLQVGKNVSLAFQSVLMTPLMDKIDGWYPDDNNNSNPDYFLQTSVGLYVAFGKTKVKDADNDGVLDTRDQCPGTPSNVVVDGNGCPLDSDKDGIFDYEDACPNVYGVAKLNGCPEPVVVPVVEPIVLTVIVPAPEKVVEKVVAPIVDTDNDGVADSDDDCPNVAGPKEFKGCPDTDGDGIQDKFDECPTVFGLAAYKGCPSSKADADGDGVPDTDDRCANTPKGFKVDLTGCPVDTDKDGIADSEDSCPDKAGEVELKGCPYDIQGIILKYNLIMDPIYFDNASFKVKPQGIDALENLGNALAKHENFGIELAGYCDSKGDEEYNTKLSENRVNSVKRVLVSRGISDDRIKIKYFGESNPAENNDLEGSLRLNRRVEYHLYEVGK